MAAKKKTSKRRISTAKKGVRKKSVPKKPAAKGKKKTAASPRKKAPRKKPQKKQKKQKKQAKQKPQKKTAARPTKGGARKSKAKAAASKAHKKSGASEQSFSSGATQLSSISFAEARRIVEKEVGSPAAREAALVRLAAFSEIVSHVHLLRGDTNLEHGLAIGEVPVLVVGNLQVSGLLDDGHDVDDTLLIVTGSLHCAHLVTLSAMVVGGDCSVEGICFGDSLGEDALTVGGALRTRLLVDHGHSFDVGALEAGIVAANDEGPHITAPIDRVLAADLFSEDRVDIALLVERLVDGGQLLRVT